MLGGESGATGTGELLEHRLNCFSCTGDYEGNFVNKIFFFEKQNGCLHLWACVPGANLPRRPVVLTLALGQPSLHYRNGVQTFLNG